MSNATLTFDADEHAQLLAALRKAMTRIQHELDTLDEQTATLRHRWDGNAQTAYIHAHSQWSATMTDLQTMLADAVTAGENAGTLFSQAESTADALWS